MNIHFIGIGGIGVSALAQYYLENKDNVFGSDLASSEITDLLKEKGAKVIIGKHSKKNIPDNIDLVIFSPAVEKDNPEFVEAVKRGIKMLSYPEALGELTKKYFTIAVSGAHGKSTTTSMIALALTKAGLDPTVIVGTKIKEFGNTNFRPGKGDYLVIEADEWQASFLNYWPKIIVLTNIEREHLDYYRDLDHILKTFKEYIGHLSADGTLVFNSDIDNNKKVIEQGKYNIVPYSLSQPDSEILRKSLMVPGEHNISNALAALAVCRLLGVSDQNAFFALGQYKGVWRRFDLSKKIIDGKEIDLVNDYGHHPTEIRVTLKAIREKFPNKKIFCIFQPHQYQRTFNLFDDFVEVFKKADINKIAIIDVYSVAGREKADIKRKVSSKKLVEAINKENVVYISASKIKKFLKELDNGNVLLLMGAGDIYELNKKI